MTMMNKFAMATIFATTLTACDYVQKNEFRAERADRHYQSAMADYSSGRLDAAIEGFEKTIRANPAHASARFQLACLLQDQKQDYLGALCCYREYLLLSGGGDKEKIAKDRAALCEKLWSVERAKKMNYADSSEMTKELAKMRREVEESAKRVAASDAQCAEVEKKNKALTEENARLRRMLTTIGEEKSDEKIAKNMTEAKSLLADVEEEGEKKSATDTRAAADAKDDSRTISHFVKQARALAEDEDAAESSALLPRVAKEDGEGDAKNPKLSDMRATLGSKKSAKSEPVHEPRPNFYIVQEGDTLYRLALRFYGRRDAWKKIMDANKAIISSDARLRAGQRLKLP